MQARPRGLPARPRSASARPAWPTSTPRTCLVIEDSLAGIVSAKGAGMSAVGVTHTYRREELEGAGAAVVVDDLAVITPGWAESLSP